MAGPSSRYRVTPLGVICLIGLIVSLYLALVWAPR